MIESEQCVLCGVFVAGAVVERDLVVERDGRFRCVNERLCGNRRELAESLKRITARRNVPGIGWVGPAA